MLRDLPADFSDNPHSDLRERIASAAGRLFFSDFRLLENTP
jgi:hypothetical protein